MRPFRFGARWASSALAVLLLASSLTCLTAACATLCAGPAAPVALSAGSGEAPAPAATALPPCHRTASNTPASAPDPGPFGACGAGSPCCALWLNDHATLRLDDPAPLRTLLPNGAALAALPLAVGASAFATDPPDGVTVPPDPVAAPPSAAPRAATGTRGPPRLVAAA